MCISSSTFIILTYISVTSIVMMNKHVIWYIHVLFFPLIYDIFCPRLCLTVLSPDELIIRETTLNQVFINNFTIFIQIHHIVVS
jgi:hypothetical protein